MPSRCRVSSGSPAISHSIRKVRFFRAGTLNPSSAQRSIKAARASSRTEGLMRMANCNRRPGERQYSGGNFSVENSGPSLNLGAVPGVGLVSPTNGGL